MARSSCNAVGNCAVPCSQITKGRGNAMKTKGATVRPRVIWHRRSIQRRVVLLRQVRFSVGSRTLDVSRTPDTGDHTWAGIDIFRLALGCLANRARPSRQREWHVLVRACSQLSDMEWYCDEYAFDPKWLGYNVSNCRFARMAAQPSRFHGEETL